MYEIVITVEDGKAEKLFELLIETINIENNKNPESKVNEITVNKLLNKLCFCPYQSDIERNIYKNNNDNYFLHFVTSNESNDIDSAAHSGKFANFLLSSSIRLDKNYEVIKDGKVDNSDKIVSLFSYIKKITITKK